MLRSIASNLILTISFAQAAYSQTMDEILKKYENEIPAAERILSEGRILISVPASMETVDYDVVYEGQIYRCVTRPSSVKCYLMKSE